VTPASSASDTPADLWQHYGNTRSRDENRRGVSGALRWDWYQRIGPGPELLGDVSGRVVADLGAGSGRQAAHIAQLHRPERVVGVDASPSQHERACAAYGHVPHVEFVRADAAVYLRQHPASFDVCYSAFGAADFTDPRELLPAVAAALVPGGTVVISTLAHYRDGSPPETEVRPAHIPTSSSNGPATLRRWVLDIPVWERCCAEAGLTLQSTETLHDPGPGGRPPVATVLMRATR
jgi:SAM-dependent methyltransferase